MKVVLKQSHIDTYENDVFKYLMNLRDSGVTNMFGATPYLMETFDFSSEVASAWLIRWMKSFD